MLSAGGNKGRGSKGRFTAAKVLAKAPAVPDKTGKRRTAWATQAGSVRPFPLTGPTGPNARPQTVFPTHR